MPNLTTNYGLKKPLANEYIKPDDFNYNSDALDAALKIVSDNATPDAALSTSSEKSVQNKVVKAALDTKLDKSGGAMDGPLTLTNPAVGTSGARNISAGTTDLVAGTSYLASGSIYFVYE